ncbi:MAG: response regulator transcription factor [Oscillospiraceae bacterium]|nr:response regulator transcription factor [Oscillospiraceae bacterium]
MKLMLIEKDPMARKLMELYIESAEDLQFVSSYAHWDAARENGIPCGLQIVIADASAISVSIGAKAEYPDLKFIAAIDSDALWIPVDGVDNVWVKDGEAESFLAVIRGTAAGQQMKHTQLPIVMIGKARSDEMTNRELEVLREIALGKTDSEIAEALCLSVSTVKYHIRNLWNKTGLINRTQLAVAAGKAGL